MFRRGKVYVYKKRKRGATETNALVGGGAHTRASRVRDWRGGI
jgi:hypothetical protein